MSIPNVVSLLLALSPLLASCGSAPKSSSAVIASAVTDKDESQKPSKEASTVVPSQSQGPPPKPTVVCRLKNELRKVEVLEVGTGCWMMYHNRGIKKRAAWSKNGNIHCEAVRENVRSNLEKAGYECKWDQ